jgi:hypothetical protein
MLDADRRAAGRDRVGEARLVQREDVRVALADEDLVARDDLRARLRDAVEDAGLAVERRLRVS